MKIQVSMLKQSNCRNAGLGWMAFFFIGMVLPGIIGSKPVTAGDLPANKPIVDKTFVVWAEVNGLEQRGGSVFTLEDPRDQAFDAITFGEIHENHWDIGSNMHSRSDLAKSGQWEVEKESDTIVQLVAVWREKEVSLYRNGSLLGQYTMKEEPKKFDDHCCVLIGPRHRLVSNRQVFRGDVYEARLYDFSLSPDQIAALTAGKVSKKEVQPVAWWDFRTGQADDKQGRFPQTFLTGEARLDSQKGCISFNGKSSAFQAFSDSADAENLAWQVDDHLNTRAPGAVGNGGYVNNIRALNKSQRVLREKMLCDPYRPVYHLVAPESVCAPFDPNGAIYWNNRYHLFYIFQDERGHCWGHVSSSDLLHWRWHTPDLAPSPEGPDVLMFSGAAFPTLKPGAVAIIWPGGCGQCLMTSRDKNLELWEKSPINPVAPPPTQPPHFAMGDPHAWLEGDTYYILGAGQRCVPSLMKTNNLDKRFEYVGDFFHHDLPEVEPWEDTSCPDFFKLRDKHVFMCLSHDKGVRYYIGRWENEQFYPETVWRLNYPGGCFYASESLVDPAGRRIFWGWLDDLPYGKFDFWSGIMSLPRVLDLDETGLPLLTPAVELERLRMAPKKIEGITIADGETIPLPEMAGDVMEYRLRIKSDDPKAVFGLKIRCSEDMREETPITIDLASQTVQIGLEKSSLSNPPYQTFIVDVFHPGGQEANHPVTEQAAPLPLPVGEIAELRIFLDKSVLELFVNDRICLTQLIYPTLPDSLGICLFSETGSVQVESLESWEISPTMQW